MCFNRPIIGRSKLSVYIARLDILVKSVTVKDITID